MDSTAVPRAYRYAAGGPVDDGLSRLVPVIDEACKSAGLTDTQRTSVPILFASSSLNIAEYEAALRANMPPVIGPRFSLMLDHLRERLGHRGRAVIFSSACASAANALLHAWQMLEHGVSDSVLVVASEWANRMSVDGFGALMLQSPSDAYRPFDARRDGLILGEAAAAAVLTTTDGSSPGTLLLRGGAACCAPGNATQSDTEDLLRVMREALASSDTIAEDLLAVRAHGTGTPANDRAEGQAITQLVADRVPVGSHKPWFGHTLGASGLVELLALKAAWDAGFFPATPGFGEADPACAIVPSDAAFALPPGGRILCNSFGFGGNNTSLVVERRC